MAEEEEDELAGIRHKVSQLELHLLGKRWHKEVADKQFLENVPPPEQYAAAMPSDRGLCALYSLFKAIKIWKRSAGDGDGCSWKSLCTAVPAGPVNALLNHFMLRAQTNWRDYDHRAGALVAARLYFEFMGVAGSGAYSVYHPRLFCNCLKCFLLPFSMLEQEELYVESSDLDSLNAQLDRLLNDLLDLIDAFDFAAFDDESAEELIAAMVEFVGYGSVDRRSNLDRSWLNKIESKALSCIEKLTVSEEEEPSESAMTLIFKALLPKFALVYGEKKILAQWRNAGFSYVETLANKYGNSIMPGLSCLIQHLSYGRDGLERVENRNIRVKLVMRLLTLMPLQPYSKLLKWFIKLSRNDKPILRLFSLEILGCIIMGTDRFSDQITKAAGEEDATFLQFDETLAENDEDLPADRTVCLSQDHQKIAHKDLLMVIYERCQDVSSSVRTKAVSLLTICTKPGFVLSKSIIQEVFQDEFLLLETATARLNDDKVSVRKAAISLMENLFYCNSQMLTVENLRALVLHCRDSSLMVRCAAITSLTSLISNCSCQVVVDAWLDGPLHQLSDPEVKVQDMVLENLKKILFDNLTKYQSASTTQNEKLPWLILEGIVKKNLRRYLSRASMNLAKSSPRTINKNLVNILKTHINTENNLKTWVLFSCIARHVQVADVDFVIKYFDELNQNQQSDIRLLPLVIEVLCEWSQSIPMECQSELNASLIKGLQNCTFPVGATRAVINLTLRLSSSTVWIDEIIKKCENNIFQSIASESEISAFDLLMMADLYLVSDMKPSDKLVETLCKIITSIDEDANDIIKAQTVAALGKVSLREKAIATISAPLCAEVLSSSTHSLPIKINAMCVLADLCVRFTSIVEPLMPGVCICLGSSNLTLRKSAVNLVTQLLVGDFLRLKGSLYFHYFSLICDNNEYVRDVANYYILQCLTQKNKNIIYHNFVECLFYYNNFKEHDTYNKVHVTDEERELFGLQGEHKRSFRHTIYDVMISQMSDMQRMNLQIKICSIVETVLKSGRSGFEILRDIIVTLRKAAKPPQSKTNSDDMAVRVTNNIVSQKMKMNMVDVVVPTVMKLYRELSTTDSPLIPEIVAYACDLLKDYKDEIEQADPELSEEMKGLPNTQGAGTSQRTPHAGRTINIPDFIDDDIDEPPNALEFENTVCSTPIIRKKSKPGSSTSKKRPTTTKGRKSLKKKLCRSMTDDDN